MSTAGLDAFRSKSWQPDLLEEDLDIFDHLLDSILLVIFNKIGDLYLAQALNFAQTLISSTGVVFFSSVGKSEFVSHKLSQTMASLDLLRSFFLPPVDALHGDLGNLFPNDLLILISKSGSSEELLTLVPCARAKGARLITVALVEGNPLAKACDMNVHLPLVGEACLFRMAPRHVGRHPDGVQGHGGGYIRAPFLHRLVHKLGHVGGGASQ